MKRSLDLEEGYSTIEKRNVVQTLNKSSPSNAENIVPPNSGNGESLPKYFRRVLSSPMSSKSGSISRSSSSSHSIDPIDRQFIRKVHSSGSSIDQGSLHVKKKQTLSPRNSDVTVTSISPRAIKELVLMNTPSQKISPTERSKRRPNDLFDNADRNDLTLSPLSSTSTASALSAKALQMIDRSLSMSIPSSPTMDPHTIQDMQSESNIISRSSEIKNRDSGSEAGALISYTPQADNEAFVRLLHVSEAIGSGLVQVGNVVGTVLSEQAGRVIENTSKIVPFYSEKEMSSIQAKKNDLLHELSMLCVRLGQAEQREKEITMQLMLGENLKDRVSELESNLDNFITENERLHSQLKYLSDENAALVSDNLMFEREKSFLIMSRSESVRENKALSVQVARLEEKLNASETHLRTVQQGLDRERERFAREEFTWHQEMHVSIYHL